jgi:YgiT-type zinc finger domain-containing protein
MICEVCGNDAFREEMSAESFRVNDRLVLVEDIPSQVCTRCGASNYSAEVTERVRRLVHEPAKPARKIEAEVLAYTAV